MQAVQAAQLQEDGAWTLWAVLPLHVEAEQRAEAEEHKADLQRLHNGLHDNTVLAERHRAEARGQAAGSELSKAPSLGGHAR